MCDVQATEVSYLIFGKYIWVLSNIIWRRIIIQLSVLSEYILIGAYVKAKQAVRYTTGEYEKEIFLTRYVYYYNIIIE